MPTAKNASLGDNSFLFDDECLFKIAEVIQKSEWHCTPPDLWLVADLFPLSHRVKETPGLSTMAQQLNILH